MRTDLEQSIRDRIRNISQRESIPPAVLWQNLVLERFLARISQMKYQKYFILKGGILLTRYLPFHRATKDLDFCVTEKEMRSSIEPIFHEIFDLDLDDGFIFQELNTKPLLHQQFSGIRVHGTVFFGKSKSKLMVDLGFGDFVEPVEKQFPLLSCSKGALFESTVKLNCYPIEFIFAEKLQILFSKGAKNSRMKDFHDLLFLTKYEEKLNLEALSKIIQSVFRHRDTLLELPIFFEEAEVANFQSMWLAYLTKLPYGRSSLPEQFSKVIEKINSWIMENIFSSTLEDDRRL